MRIFVFAFAFLFVSCSHWIAGTEVRIQVFNNTGETIRDFSVVSETGKVMVLVPKTIEDKDKSDVYEIEWVGSFRFAVFVGNEMKDLGVHRLSSGSVVARINEGFTLDFIN